ncbi:MAG TPA: hypothetical protein VHV76_11165 [Mycobacteriales bacterium]|nr:hypothetical protein [Mycobacteriales bacterium]
MRVRRASASAISPTGRLTQKTHRQSSCTSSPPITGPSPAPSAPTADHVPIARALPSAGTSASSNDSDVGTIIPAPTACATRAPIRKSRPGASPHAAEPATNMPSPRLKTNRRPTRSAHRPAGTSTAAKTMV